METTDKKRTEKQQDRVVSNVARSLDEIVRQLADVDRKIDHLIFIHRYCRYAYAQAGTRYDSEQETYDEE